jgi:hypothetical protein
MLTYNIPPHLRGDTWDGINSIIITSNNIPLNLTGATVKIEFRDEIDSPVILLLSTTNNKITISSPLSGTISIPATIIDIPFGKYIYDLQVTLASGYNKTYMKGSWEIVADVTE